MAITPEWDNTDRMYREWDGGVLVTERPYNDDENDSADKTAHTDWITSERVVLANQLRGGIAQFEAARDAAQNDVSVAASLKTQAESLSATITTQRNQVLAWNPAALYTPNDLLAIKNQLAQILATQKTIIDTIAADATWRRAVDENAIITDNGIIWLAKRVIL